LKGKIKFPRSFDSNAKSIVKHLVVADLSRRYGNLKNGVKDIKEHRWFSAIDFDDLRKKGNKTGVPYKPSVKQPHDTSNFG